MGWWLSGAWVKKPLAAWVLEKPMHDGSRRATSRNNTRSFLRGICVQLSPSPTLGTNSQATTTQAQAAGQDLLRKLAAAPCLPHDAFIRSSNNIIVNEPVRSF